MICMGRSTPPSPAHVTGHMTVTGIAQPCQALRVSIAAQGARCMMTWTCSAFELHCAQFVKLQELPNARPSTTATDIAGGVGAW